MADVAREHLDADIERAEHTRTMLLHMADAILNGRPQRRGETYQDDAVDALRHGVELARDRKINLLHVAQVYDRKVACGND